MTPPMATASEPTERAARLCDIANAPDGVRRIAKRVRAGTLAVMQSLWRALLRLVFEQGFQLAEVRREIAFQTCGD